MMTLKEMLDARINDAMQRDKERNQKVLMARVQEGYDRAFALYSGNEPEAMAAHIRRLGFDSWVVGSTVYAKIP